VLSGGQNYNKDTFSCKRYMYWSSPVPCAGGLTDRTFIINGRRVGWVWNWGDLNCFSIKAVEVEAVAVHDDDGWVCRRVWRFVVPVLPDELESALSESTVEELLLSLLSEFRSWSHSTCSPCWTYTWERRTQSTHAHMQYCSPLTFSLCRLPDVESFSPVFLPQVKRNVTFLIYR